jgi:hypothetical protein
MVHPDEKIGTVPGLVPFLRHLNIGAIGNKIEGKVA